ncbi:MAG: bifunctional ADP-heptose synthase [Bacteroidia bacterium]|nr:bifunctional ADP-heptose synthase [Bacteroidia bacterium]
MSQLASIFDQWNLTTALIVGDSMIDAYFYGTSTRNSPEAPVPIINLAKKERRLGGAANVALNIKALGATPILCSIVGKDRNGTQLKSLLEKEALSTQGIVEDESRCTTVKTRVIGNNHHYLRIDEEETDLIPTDVENQLFTTISSLVQTADVLIFQDYNKGVLSPNLIKSVTQLCNDSNVPIVVDPKHDQFFDYQNCTLFKPNRKEIVEAYQLKEEENHDIQSLAQRLRKDLNAKNVMTTLSEEGVLIINDQEHHHLPAHPRKILDVSGAGDSVLSVAALCVALELPDPTIAGLANLAGGLVCEKIGVVPVDKAQLLDEATRLGME